MDGVWLGDVVLYRQGLLAIRTNGDQDPLSTPLHSAFTSVQQMRANNEGLQNPFSE